MSAIFLIFSLIAKRPLPIFFEANDFVSHFCLCSFKNCASRQRKTQEQYKFFEHFI
jgi:hypothetical protein